MEQMNKGGVSRRWRDMKMSQEDIEKELDRPMEQFKKMEVEKAGTSPTSWRSWPKSRRSWAEGRPRTRRGQPNRRRSRELANKEFRTSASSWTNWSRRTKRVGKPRWNCPRPMTQEQEDPEGPAGQPAGHGAEGEQEGRRQTTAEGRETDGADGVPDEERHGQNEQEKQEDGRTHCASCWRTS